MSNGKLLAAAAQQFDVMVTTDQNVRFQQNLSKLPLPIIELNCRDTRFEAMQAFIPHIENTLRATARFMFVAVHPDGEIERWWNAQRQIRDRDDQALSHLE